MTASTPNDPRTGPPAAGSTAGPSWPTSGSGSRGWRSGRCSTATAWSAAEEPAAPPGRRPTAGRTSRPTDQERHLDLPLRRRQPPGDLGPQADPEQVRRQDLRRDRPAQSVQVAAVPRAVAGRRRRRPDPCADLPAAGRVQKHGQAGVEISDWWPHLATCVDDIAFVRSMYTTDNDHAAEFQMHHGRHKLDERQPVIGSWIHYGLGTLNEDLPAVRLPRPVQGPPRPRELRTPITSARSTPAWSSRSTRTTPCRSARGPRKSSPKSRRMNSRSYAI